MTTAVEISDSKPKKPKMEPSWMKIIGEEFKTPAMQKLRSFLLEEKKRHRVFPPGAEMFNAFWKTPFEKVKVVILGQDPYHGSGQAHGLCFSVRHGVTPPPSLVNIFKELERDLGLKIPNHGCLEAWAEQGVFLLNTTLSVREKKPQSHAGKGWETFTDVVIKSLNDGRENLVFLLWGRPAASKLPMLDKQKHLILSTTHPSPFSAHKGFLGCGHFSKTNNWLKSHGMEEIDWGL